MSDIKFSLLIVLVCSGCSSNNPINITPPAAVAGTTISSKFSGWGKNWCSKGEPVKNLYSSPEWNCLTVGGEIHVVRIKNGISLSDGSDVPTFDVLIPAAVDGSDKHGIALLLEKAPENIASDTGVFYWAKEFSFLSLECPDEKHKSPSSGCLDILRKKYGQQH